MTLRVNAHAVEAADAPVAETLGRALDIRDRSSVLGEPQRTACTTSVGFGTTIS
jgi:hypothetical protein